MNDAEALPYRVAIDLQFASYMSLPVRALKKFFSFPSTMFPRKKGPEKGVQPDQVLLLGQPPAPASYSIPHHKPCGCHA
jgi:hypothetical protein